MEIVFEGGLNPAEKNAKKKSMLLSMKSSLHLKRL